MRVSNRLLYAQFVRDIGESTEKLFNLNNQLSSGRRIDKPSDDPIGMSRVLIYRSELNSFGQFQKSIDLATGWLSRMDSIFMDVDDTLGRASELAVQQASATSNAATRQGAAEEIKELREMLVGLANSKYAGKYMFGGTMTQTPPFLQADVQDWQADVSEIAAAAPGAPTDGDRYINSTDNHIYQYDGATTTWVDQGAPTQGMSAIVDSENELYVFNDGAWVPQYGGNSSTFSIKIGKEDTIEQNMPGDEVFANASGDVFMTLMRLEKALRDNDREGISDTLPEIENAGEVIANKLAKLGATVNRLDQTKATLASAAVDTQESTSAIEDLDYAEAITQLQNQQTIYQATLKSTSMITGLSLVDYV
jgi:flagellar hook-associated protein 3 FlgL